MPPDDAPDIDDFLPPKEDDALGPQTSLRLTDQLAEDIAYIQKATGYGQSETMRRLLKWAISAWFKRHPKQGLGSKGGK